MRLVGDEKKGRRDIAEGLSLEKSSLDRTVMKSTDCGDKDSILFKSNLVRGMVVIADDQALLKEYLLMAKR